MGALIAGVTQATFPCNLDVIAKVIRIRDSFITLFFVALGMEPRAPKEAQSFGVLGLIRSAEPRAHGAGLEARHERPSRLRTSAAGERRRRGGSERRRGGPFLEPTSLRAMPPAGARTVSAAPAFLAFARRRVYAARRPRGREYCIESHYLSGTGEEGEAMAAPRIALLSGRPELREAVRVALSSAELGFVAYDDLEALVGACAGADPPSALLLDQASVPAGMVTAALALRATAAGANAPLFFLGSGEDGVHDMGSALAAGGDAFFRLPVEAASVVRRLATSLGMEPARMPASLLIGISAGSAPLLAAAEQALFLAEAEEARQAAALEAAAQHAAAQQAGLLAEAAQAHRPAAQQSAAAAEAHRQDLERRQERAAAQAQQAAAQARDEEHARDQLALEERAREGERQRLLGEAERQQLEASLREREARLRALEAAYAHKLEELSSRLADLELAKQQAEDRLHARDDEERHRRARLAFRAGLLEAGSARAQATGEVGRVAWTRGEVAARPTDGVVFEEGGELPVEPPPAPERYQPMDPEEGRFLEGELPALLFSAHLLGVTGALDLRHEDGRVRTLYLEEGEPVGFASELPADRPEEALLRAGLLTGVKHAELRAGPLRSARRLCSLLVEEGALKPQELFTSVRGVMTEQLLAVLEWGQGSYRWRDVTAHAADRVRLQHGFDALLAEGVRRKYDLERLWRVLGGPRTLVGPDEGPTRLPPLTHAEQAALRLLDGRRSLEEVVLDGALLPEVVLRAALLALACGAAKIVARGLPRDAAEHTLDREQALGVDKERILDRLDKARRGTYFELLGIPAESTGFEVHRACAQLRRAFDPDRFTDPAFRALKGALDEIRQVLDEAEGVLADDDLRRAYVGSLRRRRGVEVANGPRA
jgi:hypothetical protein